MKIVIVSPYVEDGILKVNVLRIDRGVEAPVTEALSTDGSWRISSLYQSDPGGGFSVPKAMTQSIVEKLSQ